MSFGDAMTNNLSLQPTSSEDSESRADATYFTTEQADEAINLLQKSINRDRTLFASFGTSSAALDINFSAPDLEASSAFVDSAVSSKSKKKKIIENGMVVWSGAKHCEAIATSILRYPDNAILEDQQDLRDLILVRTIF